MVKFRKVIGRPGVFRVNTPKGKAIKALTPEYWNSVYKTAKDMLSQGLKIPSPFSHKDDNGIVPSVLNEDDNDAETLTKKTWSSDINAGFWEDFEIDEKNQLVGVLNIPDEKVAEKLSKTIKETSVFVEPEFVDGLGRTWKNALRHVALVTNPVDPNQDNFERILGEKDYSLAMSFSMADEISPVSKPTKDTSDVNGEDTTTDPTSNEDSTVAAGIPEIVSLIKDKLGYEMPSDTDEKNFLDRLRTILVSIKQSETDEEMKDFTQKPKKAETESSTVVMADEVKNENPDNVVLMEKKVSKLLDLHIAQLKDTLLAKINKLIQRGVIGKAKAEKDLIPAVSAISMSLDDLDEDGNCNKHPIEMALDMLDEQAGLLDKGNDEEKVGEAEQLPDEEIAMSDEEAEKLYKELNL